jgi:putative tryptophan/tyrosine transport system substrate-binding protein
MLLFSCQAVARRLARPMKRRDFITLLGSAAVAFPLPTRAQQPAGRPLIGMLLPIAQAEAAPNVAEFRAALRELGYIEAHNVDLELRYSDGVPERLPQLAMELVASRPHVILAGSQAGALAARNATRTIPLVVITSDDPVATGLVQSIRKPGSNVTGTWTAGDDAVVGKRLEFLREIVPDLARVGILVSPDDPADAINYKRVPAAARALGLSLRLYEVRKADFNAVFAQAVREGMQGLFISEAPTFNSRPAEIAAIAATVGLPAVYGFRAFAVAGGLMSYGVSLPGVFRRSAVLVDKSLRGTSPADLPVELPVRWEFVINLRTARTLGLAVPTALLLRADEVIE